MEYAKPPHEILSADFGFDVAVTSLQDSLKWNLAQPYLD
jgi:hypothetical protein